MPAARSGGFQGIRWRGNLLGRMQLFSVAFNKGLGTVLKDKAQEVQDYAQENAPWGDRTGDARAGLTAEAKSRLAYHYIDLFHTVDYGIWLEIRWNGTYAIILPTLQHFGPQVMDELDMAETLAHGY